MSQRAVAVLIAISLIAALWIAALLVPLPYVTYAPGVTVDVLGKEDGKEIIEVSGHKTYREDGELRMTTVYVTRPDAKVNLLQVMGSWLDPEEAVYPHDAVYRPEETDEDAEREGAQQMVSSQDAATANALRELGYDVSMVVKVLDVQKGLPADGALSVGDVILRVDSTRIESAQDVVDAVTAVEPGGTVRFQVERDGERLTVPVTPKAVEGRPRVGIVPGPGFEFPFQVHVRVDPDIGGPSAGLMFSLAIYDTLTPGSLTGDEIVAGTGTIDESGEVGPIGGIQQKIVAARDAGARLFMVPPRNCSDAVGAPRGDMRLVKATTMHVAVEAIDDWTADHDADLPSCDTADAASTEGTR